MSGECRIDHYLGAPEVGALIECAGLRRDRGCFAPARIGSASQLQRREEIRGDFTCWIEPPLFPAEQSLIDKLEILRLELNANAFLGLFDLELHFAWYPPGSGYARHVDRPSGRRERTVSLVLYLTEHWTPEAGGELRFYEPGGTHHDVAPIAGRLVYFLTSGCEHAVLPTRCDRLSISGWFRTRE